MQHVPWCVCVSLLKIISSERPASMLWTTLWRGPCDKELSTLVKSHVMSLEAESSSPGKPSDDCKAGWYLDLNLRRDPEPDHPAKQFSDSWTSLHEIINVFCLKPLSFEFVIQQWITNTVAILHVDYWIDRRKLTKALTNILVINIAKCIHHVFWNETKLKSNASQASQLSEEL